MVRHLKTLLSERSPVVQKLAILASLFIVTLVSILFYTIVNLHEQRLDEVVVDLAGRQRMLNQRHMKEILLVSRGLPVDYPSTRNVLNQTLEALSNGGPAIFTLGKEETVQLLPAPTEEIKERLAMQKNLIRDFTVKADEFLRLSAGDPAYSKRLEELLALNGRLQDVANDAVKLFTEHAESKDAAMIRWEAVIGLFAGLLAILLTRQIIQANRMLENDITERKRAEATLHESEERFRALYDDNPSMYFTVDADGTVLSVNRFGTEQLGYRVDELVGHSVLTVFHEEDRQKAMEYLHVAFQTPAQAHQWELRKVRKNGCVLWVREDVRIIQDSAGKPLALVVCEDITERKRAEEELRISEERRVEALRQSGALKAALLSSASHELRTPLTAMKTSVSSLLENAATMTDKLRKEFLEGINQEIDYLNRLVDNLLDMSRIEAGMLVPRCEWYPLEDLVEGAFRRVGASLRDRPLEVRLPDEVPSVLVDGVEIQQVLVNLLDNAIKYSPSDSLIRIEARPTSQAVEVRVSNSGQGIPSEDLERVFDRFYRVRSGRERMVHGTGLGLAICKGIIEAHGGRIWAESTPGQETTITFTLPQTESMPAVSLEGLNPSRSQS